MELKIFKKFIEGVPSNENTDNELWQKIICGKNNELEFTMRRFVPVHGHDDSLPYSADLYLNGKGLCHCFNDGWGGETCLTPMGKNTHEKLSEINDRLKSNFSWEYKNMIFKLELEYIADTLACYYEYTVGHYRRPL